MEIPPSLSIITECADIFPYMYVFASKNAKNIQQNIQNFLKYTNTKRMAVARNNGMKPNASPIYRRAITSFRIILGMVMVRCGLMS